MTLPELNSLPKEAATLAFLGCCGSHAWAAAMAAARPFGDREAVFRQARENWARLTEPDWLEAFAAHPRIGDLKLLRARLGHLRAVPEDEEQQESQESREQSAVTGASEATLRDLKSLNDSYFARHGFVFLIFATGKSADQMLDALRGRLPNPRADEVRNAMHEQGLITRNRLEKLLS